ncbi:hypothetical protein [Chroococcidiopsis sp. CCMEE 29]|uniref:hypothetical protein n=1 Tax=Chroococcidiopsis sp. CCMEE 29 TaxID=155894 RepID=UPI0020220DC0|nr:hypothetical protein [Chroococcidiopsis sp. CCMEE 29]
MYFYTEELFNCFSLRRPGGESFMFLQGDDATTFEKELDYLRKHKYPNIFFKTYEEGVSELVSMYDVQGYLT